METIPAGVRTPTPSISHQDSRKSLHTLRSTRSKQSIKSIRSTKSTTSVRVFNHGHLTYHTCFGTIHVKTASSCIGFSVLLLVCLSLVYCVFTSQEQRRPNMKLYSFPFILIIVALLYMFVGILQKKSQLLYPFIAVQILVVFITSITIVMICIAVVCRTKYILQVIVEIDDSSHEQDYLRIALATASILLSQLFIQLWALRAVCGCYRYFNDLNKFNVRNAQLNYV